jgi:hypothetical protein
MRSDPMHWKEYLKSVVNMSKTVMNPPKEPLRYQGSNEVIKGVDSRDYQFVAKALKESKSDGIPTVYLS